MVLTEIYGYKSFKLLLNTVRGIGIEVIPNARHLGKVNSMELVLVVVFLLVCLRTGERVIASSQEAAWKEAA